MLKSFDNGLQQSRSTAQSSANNRVGPYRSSHDSVNRQDKTIIVKNLRKHFKSGLFVKTIIKAVDGVSFEIGKKETFGIVGESGCGKSTVGRCLVKLIEPTGGDLFFNGVNIAKRNRDIRKLRKKMQIIFQDADGALNPRMTVSDLLLEPLRVHGLASGRQAENVLKLMDMVNLTPDLLERYPHELSGGQRQRIGIARAVSLNPDFIVADEVAASLDLLVQAQMVNLIKRLQSERGISCLYISHNLKLVRALTHNVAVMYLGQFVEMGQTNAVFDNALHPYTQLMLASVPGFDPLAWQKRGLLKGEMPSPFNPPSGCGFHPRCPQARGICSHVEPELRRIDEDHWVKCHNGVTYA